MVARPLRILAHAGHAPAQTDQKGDMMNSIKRLWHWYKDRRIERQALKGHDMSDGHHRSQSTTPIVGIAEDARLRWLMKSGRR